MKRSRPRGPRYGSMLALFLWGAAGTGCVERLLQVRSDPPGADVYINGKSLGTTPLEFGFTHYGTVDVILRHEEHLSHRELLVLRPPWYEWFPLDFIAEIVVPWTIEDHHDLDVTLTPSSRQLDPEDVTALRERAAAARSTLP